MNDLIQKLSDSLLSSLGKMAGDMLTSPLGIGLLAAAAFLFIFPVARSIWRTSRYLFGGVILLLIAVAMFRPELPKQSGPAQATVESGPLPTPIPPVQTKPTIDPIMVAQAAAKQYQFQQEKRELVRAGYRAISGMDSELELILSRFRLLARDDPGFADQYRAREAARDRWNAYQNTLDPSARYYIGGEGQHSVMDPLNPTP